MLFSDAPVMLCTIGLTVWVPVGVLIGGLWVVLQGVSSCCAQGTCVLGNSLVRTQEQASDKAHWPSRSR